MRNGELPIAELTSAGFTQVRNGFSRQLSAGSLASPGGSKVLVAPKNGPTCNVIVSYSPFNLQFARNAIIGGLIDDGWSHEGNLIYVKGASRIKLSGGGSYGLVSIQLKSL